MRRFVLDDREDDIYPFAGTHDDPVSLLGQIGILENLQPQPLQYFEGVDPVLHFNF